MIEQIIKEHQKATQFIYDCRVDIERVSQDIIRCLNLGGTLFIAGNGGSASDAQHFSAELVGRFSKERKSLRAICLNTDTSALTAIANDYGYPQVFKRQLEGIAKTGDLFIAISTSGKSENLLNAIEWANINGIKTISFSGNSETMGAKKGFCVPSTNTARIQEMHILIIHILCALIDEQF